MNAWMDGWTNEWMHWAKSPKAIYYKIVNPITFQFSSFCWPKQNRPERQCQCNGHYGLQNISCLPLSVNLILTSKLFGLPYSTPTCAIKDLIYRSKTWKYYRPLWISDRRPDLTNQDLQNLNKKKKKKKKKK